MARIAAPRKTTLGAKFAYTFTRKAFERMTGRVPDRALEPLEVMAHSPKLLAGYGKIEQAVGKLHRVDQRLSDLAELKAAAIVSCEYCIDLGSQIARRRSRITDEELLALPLFRESPLFTEVEKLVMSLAVAMSRTPVEVPDSLFAALRERFDEGQLVELAYVIAHENTRGRFNLAFGIGAAGFSEGMVCAVPSNRGRDS